MDAPEGTRRGMTGKIRKWNECSTRDISAIDSASTIAVFPVGATEQHGPHLPLGTDTFIAEAVLEAAAIEMNSGVSILVLPVQPVGLSVEHEEFAGTLSGEAATLLSFWKEIAAGVARAGIRKIVLFNSHGGQSALLTLIAQDLRRHHRMTAAAYHCYRVWRESSLFTAEERRHGIHGGAIETSILLAARPDLVQRENLDNFSSIAAEIEKSTPALVLGGKMALAWQMRDLNRDGAAGDAAAASAEAGRVLLEAAAKDFARFVEDFSRLDSGVIPGNER